MYQEKGGKWIQIYLLHGMFEIDMKTSNWTGMDLRHFRWIRKSNQKTKG